MVNIFRSKKELEGIDRITTGRRILGGILALRVLLTCACGLEVEDGLVAYWPFEGSLNDKMGGYYGVARGSSPIVFTDGQFGKCISLNGIDQFVEIMGGDQLDFNFETTSFTVALWCSPASFESLFGTLIGKRSGSSFSWSFGRFGDRRGVNFYIAPFPGLLGNLLVDDQFHQVALVVDRENGNVAGFVNGMEVWSEGFTTLKESRERVTIGGSSDLLLGEELDRWHGSIDDVAIWRRALSADEIASLWNDGRGTEIGTLIADGDRDGMHDFWEQEWGLDWERDDHSEDPDGDGLSNLEEYVMKTDPRLGDSDGDGLGDHVETRTGVWASIDDTGTDPGRFDSDGDGLSDGEESMAMTAGRARLDPNRADTDRDGFVDGDEVEVGTTPDEVESYPGLDFGLVAYWPFDQGLEDAIGDHQGEAVGDDEGVALIDGMFGGALELRGGGVEFGGDQAVFDFKESARGFSISLWLKQNFAQRGVVIGNGNLHPWAINLLDAGEIGFHAGVVRDKLLTEPEIRTAFSTKTLSNTMRLRSFDHLAAVYDATAHLRTVYVNGVELINASPSSTLTKSEIDGAESLVIGGSWSGTLRFWRGVVDDLAIWSRPLTKREVHRLWAEGDGRSVGRLTDTLDEDQDGMLDAWEQEYGIDATVANAGEDPDADGSTNIDEFLRNTNPKDEDTDDDGLIDSVENHSGIWTGLSSTGTDPLDADTDGDGLGDGAENPDGPHVGIAASGSDPNLLDTDGDGHTDFEEAKFGSDPGDALRLLPIGAGLAGYWPLDGNFEDRGNSGLHGSSADNIEFVSGRYGQSVNLTGFEAIEIDDRSIEALDFVNESFSVAVWARLAPSEIENPQNKAIALIGKGISGSWSLERLDYDVRAKFGQAIGISAAPGLPGLDDGRMHHLIAVADVARETSCFYVDGDLVGKGSVALSPSVTGSDHPVVIGNSPQSRSVIGWSGLIDDVAIWRRVLTNAEAEDLYESGLSVDELVHSDDADDDGMNDVWEARTGLDPTMNDGERDADEDGLTNIQEFHRGTDPLAADSDGDGLRDGVESGSGRWLGESDTGTDVLVWDSDGDGLADGEENPGEAFLAGVNAGSDPNRADSDGDTYSDSDEFRFGVDPTTGQDIPGAQHGLIGYWRFDGDFDDAAGGHHGQGVGRAPIAFEKAKFGDGVELDGITQHVRVGEQGEDSRSGRAFDLINQSFSLSAWFQIPENHRQAIGVLLADGWSADQYDYDYVSFTAGFGRPQAVGPVVNDNVKYHV